MKPAPEHDDDQKRWRIGELRTRILDGEWTSDLEVKMTEFFAVAVIARIESARDISRNPARYAWNATNTVYEVAPTAELDTDGSAAEQPDLRRIVTPELWPVRAQAQLLVVALGECAMRVDVRSGRIRYRSVSPVLLEAYAGADDPSRPVWVRETMLRQRYGQEAEWTRETWDVQDPKAPSFRAERYSLGTNGGAWVDVTDGYFPAANDGYPYVDADGPIMPYELCHLLISGRLWSPTRWEELVQTTLVAGCLQTFWNAGFRDCAYPLRWAMDVDVPASASLRGEDPTADRVVADGTSLTMLHSRGDKTGSTGTFVQTMEPVSSLASIDSKVSQALRDAGLGPTDEAPAKGVSGAAITISRESLRREQRRQIPAARLADQHLLATAARLSNSYLGTSLPTDPEMYCLDYHGVPPSTDEVLAAVQRATSLMSAGLTTRKRAIMEVYPEMTPAQAADLADEIAATTKAKNDAIVAASINAAAGFVTAAVPTPRPQGDTNEPG